MSATEVLSVESDAIRPGPSPRSFAMGRPRPASTSGHRPRRSPCCSAPLARTPAPALSSSVLEQRRRDRLPFLVERGFADRLLCASIPVGGVTGVALLSVQIGVHPVAGAALVGLRGVVRAVPVALRVEPKRAQRMAERRGGLVGWERGAEAGQVHGSSLSRLAPDKP